MGSPAIVASGIGKRYLLGGGDLAVHSRTLRGTIASWASARVRREGAIDPGAFWALKDVGFAISAGEMVGVIGQNGAGKSTLLKVLSRITEPTEGEVTIRGRVGSLLEVGTGFHLELTGRENVYLNGAILGMRRAEVAKKFDEIVAFAGLDAFLDTPVKHYSSGMYMRLAFAVGAHLETDILIVDEILAVGDAAFQKKCLGKMDDVAKHGRTVLFVSHNLGAIRSLCTRGLVLGEGRVRFDGTASDAIAEYLALSAASGASDGQIAFDPGLVFDSLTLHGVRLVDDAGEVRALFDATDPIRIEIDCEVRAGARGIRTVLLLATQEGELAFQSTDHSMREPDQSPGRYRVACTIPGGLLNRRMYVVEVSFEVPGERTIAPRRPYLSFVVAGGGNHGSTYPEPWPGAVCPKLEWQAKRLPA
jgi:lipopolysaccharide transport system ATP-binding protein